MVAAYVGHDEAVGHVVRYPAHVYDGVLGGDGRRVARFLAQDGVGMPVTLGQGLQRFLGEAVGLLKGEDVRVLLAHPCGEDLLVGRGVVLHAFQDVVGDDLHQGRVGLRPGACPKAEPQQGKDGQAQGEEVCFHGTVVVFSFFSDPG